MIEFLAMICEFQYFCNRTRNLLILTDCISICFWFARSQRERLEAYCKFPIPCISFTFEFRFTFKFYINVNNYHFSQLLNRVMMVQSLIRETGPASEGTTEKYKCNQEIISKDFLNTFDAILFVCRLCLVTFALLMVFHHQIVCFSGTNDQNFNDLLGFHTA